MNKIVISRNGIEAGLVGLLFPVINFLIALVRPNSYNLKVAFVLFFVFIGFAYYFEFESGADVSKTVILFLDASKTETGFINYFHSIPKPQQVDYYQPFMIWLVSRFTSNYHIFLGCLALIYACFFAANVNYLVKHVNIQGLGILLLVVFVFIPRIIMMTHRWWTALQVFIYGMLPVLYEKKYRKLLWCIATPFIFHFTFFYPLIVLIMALILPKKQLWPYILIYLISFLIDSFDFTVFVPYVNTLFNETITSRTENYINYELLEHNLFSQTSIIAMNIVNVVMIVYIYYKIKNEKEEILKRIFVVTALMGTFASMVSLTEWGWRYYEISNMLFMFLYLVYFADNNRYNESVQLLNWLSPLLLYFIAFQIRGFLNIIGPYQLFLGNYFTTWFIHDTSSVWDLIN